jgi:hydroxyethylthiazole kinase-like uncharacterized protein yjeF
VRPVVTVAEMQAADAGALRTVDEATLVERAGTAVALGALEMLSGAYGRRVTVVAGKGNNGADGRVAARLLTRRGARVTVVEAGSAERLAACDLVIDAAYGTGFRGSYTPPAVPTGTRVLAVDVPSGIDGDTGLARGVPWRAERTVTFQALKPGLLQADGPDAAGAVHVADLGIVVSEPRAALVEDADADRLPARGPESHKWAAAVLVVAGSPGMEGAAALSAEGALRAGSGMVRLAVPGSAEPAGGTRPGPWPLEVVRVALPDEGFDTPVLSALERCRALVVGPGLGRRPATGEAVRRLVAASTVPTVLDADGLFAFADPEALGAAVAAQPRAVVVTPHDGEYARLVGEAPGPDRIAAARALADRCGAVVLLKGSLTVVAAPPGAHLPGVPGVLLAGAGSSRLATGGTGDVLSGVIGAFCARGLEAPLAAALAAHVHGRAAASGRREGLVAGDLPPLVADWLSARRAVAEAAHRG